MRKNCVVLVLLMCVFSGCYRTVKTVEFEQKTEVEMEIETRVDIEEIVIPDVYMYELSDLEVGQHMLLNTDIKESEMMDLFAMEYKVSIPIEATLSSYYLYDNLFYYSYDYYMYIYSDYETVEEKKANPEYITKVMCYDITADVTTEIASFSSEIVITNLCATENFLSWTKNEKLEPPGSQNSQRNNSETEVFSIQKNSGSILEVPHGIPNSEKFLGLAADTYAITYDGVQGDLINTVFLTDLNTGETECIMPTKAYENVKYSEGYFVFYDKNQMENSIAIYDLNGIYVNGFVVTAGIEKALYNVYLCAWIAVDEKDNHFLYIYDNELCELNVMNYSKLSDSFACDGDRVYFDGKLNSGVACYDLSEKRVNMELYGDLQYGIRTNGRMGIYGQINNVLSSSVEVDENGWMVYNFYSLVEEWH